MSAAVPQKELEQRVLVAFYNHAQQSDDRLTAEMLHEILKGEFGVQRIELAIENLISGHLIEGQYSMGLAPRYSITNDGYQVVEEAYFKRLESQESAKLETDPIEKLDTQIAPAADRLVSFSDNSSQKDDAVGAVEKAEEVIRKSNTIDPELKEDSANSLSAWRDLIQNTKSFAVGAFKFLVWDRIRAVVESAIENVYKTVLTGILITLGSIIVSLL